MGEMPSIDDADRILAATARIVTAWLQANVIAAAALPEVIRVVHRALANLDSHYVREQSEEHPPSKPGSVIGAAVDIRKSVFADYLVCLEDGKRATMLKRHLRTAHGLTPEQYRTKYGLPPSYPMVAPNYAKVRSRLAKDAGLGKNGRPRK